MSPRRLLMIVLAALTIALLPTAPATAAADGIQDRVDDVIAQYGGIQTAYNEVTWDDGAIILTLAGDGIAPLAVASCPSGSYCAYSAYSYAGSRLQFTTCTTGNPVGALPSVKSIANSRTSGTVRAYNGATLVTTVAPNTGKTPINSTVTTLSCS